MAETERVVVSAWSDDSMVIYLDPVDPEHMHRAWSSWERNKRDHPEFYKGSLPTQYPILPKELVDRYNAAKAAFDAVAIEVAAAVEYAPRKTLNSYAVELGWTIDDF